MAVGFTAAVIGLAPPARAVVPVLHLDGRGHGHGVGLAQWGARYAADAGADVATILATFYPGTELDLAEGPVRVAVHAGPDAVLGFPQGGELRSPLVGDQVPGFPVVVPAGGLVAVRPADGGFQVEAVVVGQSATVTPAVVAGIGGAAQDGRAAQCLPILGPCPPPGSGGQPGECLLGCVTVPPPPAPPGTPPGSTPPPESTAPPGTLPPPPTDTTAPPEPPPPPVSAGSVYAVPVADGATDVTARGRTYRGIVEAVADPAGLRLVNELDVETYLKGMAEVPTSWPAAAQEAQAVAARTYVLRAMAASGEVCDHERCQVYAGAGREDPAQSAAVDATAGVVLTYGGQLAAAVYSADAGGITATATEGFGPSGGNYPYLTNVRYDTPDPRPWAADVALADVGRRFAYPGTVTGVRVAETGPSGRAVTVAIEGDAGALPVDGRTFARGLGLRSTLFGVSITTAATAPAPLVDAELEEPMTMPDDAEAMAAAIGATAGAAGAGGAGDRSAAGAAGPSGASGRASSSKATASTPGSAGGGGGPMESRPVTLLAVAGLGVATAIAMARAGGLEAAGLALTKRPTLKRRARPRPGRPSSRAAPRPGPGRPPR